MKNLYSYLILPALLACTMASAQSNDVQVQLQASRFEGFNLITADDHYAIGVKGEIMDVQKGVVLHLIPELSKSWNTHLSLMADNRHVVLYKEGELKVIEFTTNTVTRHLKSNGISTVWTPRVSHDGTHLLYTTGTDPLEDVGDKDNNKILAQATAQNGVYVLKLPEATVARRIETGFPHNQTSTINGNTVAITGMYHKDTGTYVECYNIETGQLIRQLKLSDGNIFYHKLLLSPNGRFLFAASAEGDHAVIDISTGKRLQSFDKEALEMIDQSILKFNDEGNKALLYLENSADVQKILLADLVRDRLLYRDSFQIKTLHTIIKHDLSMAVLVHYNPQKFRYPYLTSIDFENKGKVNPIHPPINGKIYFPNLIFTRKKDYLLCYDLDEKRNVTNLFYYNYKTRRTEKSLRMLGIPNAVNLHFNPDDYTLYFQNFTSYFFQSPVYNIRLHDGFKIAQTFPGEQCDKYCRSDKTGTMARAIVEWYFKLGDKPQNWLDSLNLIQSKTVLRIAAPGQDAPEISVEIPWERVVDMAFHENGSQLLLVTETITILRYKNGQPVLPKITNKGRLLRLQLNTGLLEELQLLSLDDVRQKLLTDPLQNHLYVFANSTPSQYRFTEEPLTLWDKRQFLLKMEAVSGKIVASFGAQDGHRLTLLAFNQQHLVCLMQAEMHGQDSIVALSADLKKRWAVAIRVDGDPRATIDRDGHRLFVLSSAFPQKGALATVFDLHTGQVLQQFLAPPEIVDDLIYYKDYLLSQHGLFGLKPQRMVLQWTVFNDIDFWVKTVDNYYMTGKKTTDCIRFSRNNTSFPCRQFDLLYNRPDKVLELMPDIRPEVIAPYELAWQKRLQKSGFKATDLSKDASMPQVEVLNNTIPFETTDATLVLQVSATDPALMLDRVLVWINDVPVFGRNGVSLRDKKTSRWQENLSLPLSAGLNTIQVSCINEKGVESLLEQVEITRKTPVQKPDLYLLVIGVSKYADAHMNLRYATRDAQDVVALFSSQKNAYKNIFVQELLDAQVTTTAVMQVKKWVEKSGVDDQVIVFVAGHGLLDDQLDYYLATHDVDFLHPAEKGLAYDALEDLLDNIPARKKLILMDACHSGEIDKEGVTQVKTKQVRSGTVSFRAFDTGVAYQAASPQKAFEMMRSLFIDLRRNTGTTAISSSGGMEFSMEGDKWQNGVFTWCLKKGLGEKSADLDGDGNVMVSELQQWLGVEVSNLTGGRQRPTFRTENITNDWKIW
jgi:hypothetical protein